MVTTGPGDVIDDGTTLPRRKKNFQIDHDSGRMHVVVLKQPNMDRNFSKHSQKGMIFE
jgi:hypothetical protein